MSNAQLRGVIHHVLSYKAHTDIRFEKYMLNIDLRNYQSILADYDGQKNNYRITLNDGRDIHIKEYDDCFLIHWDYANPSKDPIGHLINDAPHWILSGLEFISALLIVYAISKRH